MIDQIYLDVEQGSDAWHKARLGHITASHISDVMAKGKGKEESITRYKYKVRLVAERMTGETANDAYTNSAMEWGVEQEQYACIQSQRPILAICLIIKCLLTITTKSNVSYG